MSLHFCHNTQKYPNKDRHVFQKGEKKNVRYTIRRMLQYMCDDMEWDCFLYDIESTGLVSLFLIHI